MPSTTARAQWTSGRRAPGRVVRDDVAAALADAVRFLASDAGRCITGQTIDATGGTHL
ncbi:hypothetical protein OG989_23935 [Micromonospora sp. NBC_01740]|uniref:hypothetical protein n=1 Tax=Micromonospora sp. NBC_01740 TaxID=2975986 RepID=UPI002E13B493|nr:hypothetical protein OG989_23935 [Micromonospora sp. NBC_01740]